MRQAVFSFLPAGTCIALCLLSSAGSCHHQEKPIDTGITADTDDSLDTTDTATPDTAETGIDPPPLHCTDLPWKAVATGVYATCGIHTDGCLECWGNQNLGFQDMGDAIPPEGVFTQVDMATYMDFGGVDRYMWHTLHACAIEEAGSVACWGRHADDVMIPPEGTFARISTGSMHTCGILTNGQLVCWGQGSVEPPEGEYTDIDSELDFSCAIDSDGRIVCFGWIDSGWEIPEGFFVGIRSAWNGMCAIDRDGNISCFQEYVEEYFSPTLPVEDICFGGDICAILSDSSIDCWQVHPVAYFLFPPSGTFTTLACNAYHACAIDTDGRLACWGESAYGATTPPGSYVKPSEE